MFICLLELIEKVFPFKNFKSASNHIIWIKPALKTLCIFFLKDKKMLNDENAI